MSIFVLAAIGSAFLHPWSGVAVKKAAHPLTLNSWAIIFVSLAFLPVFWMRDLWPLVGEYWVFILISSVFKAIYGTLVMYLLGRHELQVLYPLTRLAPIFIFAGEIAFLGASFSWVILAGIVAIVTGALIFGFDRKIAHVRRFVFFSIALVTFSVVILELADKKLLEVFTPLEIVAITAFQAPFMMISLLVFRKEAMEDLRRFPRILGLIFVMSGSFYLSRFSMQELDASVAASLRNLSILFGVFLGAHLFDEGHKWLRYAAAGLIIVGAGVMVGGS